MKIRAVLLDTSFFIRLHGALSPLQVNAEKHIQYLLRTNVALKISTISIAEYCVKGSFDRLPISILNIIDFRVVHALAAARLSKIAFENREQSVERSIIANDTKLLAQADAETDIDAYITSDSRSMKLYKQCNNVNPLSFQFIDLHTPWHEVYSVLDL